MSGCAYPSLPPLQGRYNNREKKTQHLDFPWLLFGHKCPEQVSITSKTDLDLHTVSVHNCPDCGIVFSDNANMYRQKMNKQGGAMCAGCPRSFPSRLELRIHQRSYCGGWRCQRTSDESGTIGGRKEKEFVDENLTAGKHPTI